MTEPTGKDQSQTPKSAREARLAAALRANLARRKAQIRARAAEDAPPDETD